MNAPASLGAGAVDGLRVHHVDNGPFLLLEVVGHPDGPRETLRAAIQAQVWEAIHGVAEDDFNRRLEALGLPAYDFSRGRDLVLDRLLGRELCVLAWAAEQVGLVAEYSIVCRRWAALRPEERWWLYHMTAAEAGGAEDGARGWRRALYEALSDGGGP